MKRDDVAGDDLVPEDDEVIGRALRFSAIAAVLVAAGVGGWMYLQEEEVAPEVVLEKDAGEIPDLVQADEAVPQVTFTDVTAEAGIDFVHFDGARGDKLLPETMGGGVAFLDYDDDGDADLLFVNGSSWPEDPEPRAPGNRLYRNDGTGRFEDVTEESGVAGAHYGTGVAVGDYDGDGRVDLFFTGVGGNRLLHNDGGRFRDVTASAGVGGASDQWTTSAAFLDYDGDDDLDLFVCHYVKWSREIDEQQAFTLNGVDRAYGPPMTYAGTFSTLFRNGGDGTFADVSEEAGIHVANSATGAPMGKALGVAVADFDGDGAVDIAVANDTVQNHLFHNRGDGTFEEIGFSCGIGFDTNGQATGAMGIDVADYRGDGNLGVAIANFANEMSSLFVAGTRSLSFTDDAIGEGLGSPSRTALSFGLFFFDYDLDGRLDLLQLNGHLEETINEVQPSQHYLQTPQLFWNSGPDSRSCFQLVPAETTGDLSRKLVGRGSAFADIDGDGDLDVVLTQVNRPPLLLRNDQAEGHHWLRVKLVGHPGNREAIGAWVEVQSAGRTLRRRVAPARSYLSQSELPLTFGLGDATAIDSIHVIWPDGVREDVPVPEGIDRQIEVVRK